MTTRKRALRRQKQKRAVAHRIRQFRLLLTQRPKRAHQQIFQEPSTTDTAPGECFRDPDTSIATSDPTEGLDIQRKHLQRTYSKAIGPNPAASQDAPPPWHFALNEQAPTISRTRLLPHIQDYGLFLDCLRRASNNKSPGWDEIPNELLKYLPDDMLRSIHSMFVAMWTTGITPTSWKTSNTVMLYKKGDPPDPANYRPIGLSLALYMLWTSVLTDTLMSFSEQHSLLNSSQEGFRPGRNTHRQLSNVINALEDAARTKQDIYLLFIDFSAAFDTVDHTKLLQVMGELGNPPDAIQVVQNLYTGAQTRIKTQHGTSAPITLERGTIQGDTLSPFLFLIFI